MQICSIHNIKCDIDGWMCPVCGNERCSQCEYLNCVVDGIKKDYDCCFSCPFCDGFAGKDHLVKCSCCGAEGCSVCVRTASVNRNSICPDCGSICSICQKTYLKEWLTKCDLCPSYVCSLCEIVKCEHCGKTGCHQHSFQCVHCGKFFCAQCLGGIDTGSNSKLCVECSHTCSNCGSISGINTTTKCKHCEKEICRKCAIECTHCGSKLCKTHAHRCSICGNYRCENHSDLCPACGGYSCHSHFFKCGMCDVGYCQKCRVDPDQFLCNLCDNLITLDKGKIQETHKEVIDKNPSFAGFSKWEYSEGREIYIFYGKSLMSNCLLTVDKNSKKVLSSKKIGILSKLKKMIP